MDDRAIPLLVAVLAIVAVGLTAATLTWAVVADGSSGTFAPRSHADGFDGRSGEPMPLPDGPTIDGPDGPIVQGIELQFCVDALQSGAGTAALVGTFAVLLGGIYRRYNGPLALLAGWILLSPIMLVYFLFTNCGSAPPGDGGNQWLRDVPFDDPGISSGTPPTWLLAALVSGVLVGAVGVLVHSLRHEEGDVVPNDADHEVDPELAEFAEAARRASDRIQRHDAPVDNAVYRAWVEMTGLLDVRRPETYTPGEFADAAVALGMGPEDVDELTRLFEEVRYGARDPADREDRALAVLRRIERAYGIDPTGDEQ